MSGPGPASAAVVNRLCPWGTVEEEQAGREEAVAGAVAVYRALLPKLIKDLDKIPEVRQPNKIKHKLTVLVLYGLLGFVFGMASRREANREMSRPMFLATLKELFPELDSLPHADTLNRVLEKLEVERLEQALVGMARRLIRNKKLTAI